MQQISGPGQGPFTTLALLISGLLRFIAITILGLIALILGLGLFIIIIVPLIIYLIITKRKFINVLKSTKTRFNSSASTKTYSQDPFTSFTSPHSFSSPQQNEEEVDIDVPAKEDN